MGILAFHLFFFADDPRLSSDRESKHMTLLGAAFLEDSLPDVLLLLMYL